MAVALALVAATPVNAEETTSIKPGGLYTVEVTVTKPSGMSLSSGWEIRFYIYSSTSCFNGGDWWDTSDTGAGPWLYTGYWDYRVRNQSWTTPDTKTWSTSIQVASPVDNWVNAPRYPADLTLDQAEADNALMSDQFPTSVTLRARLEFRNMSPTFEGDQVTFKIAGTTYKYKCQQDSYGRYWLNNSDDTDVGSSGYFSQSEGTSEWTLNYPADATLLVDNVNAPATGTIVVSNPIVTGLASAGVDVILFAGIGGVVMVVAVVAIVMFRKKKGGEMGAPEMAPLPPPPPEVPPAPPSSPNVPGFTLPQA